LWLFLSGSDVPQPLLPCIPWEHSVVSGILHPLHEGTCSRFHPAASSDTHHISELLDLKKDYSAIADRVCKEEKKNIESAYKNIYDSYNDKYKTVSNLKISKFTASIADTSFRVDSDDGCPVIKVSIKLGYTYKIQYSGSDKANDKNNNNNSAYIYYKYEDGKWKINSMYLGFGFY
jgi:hypothetical protein